MALTIQVIEGVPHDEKTLAKIAAHRERTKAREVCEARKAARAEKKRKVQEAREAREAARAERNMAILNDGLRKHAAKQRKKREKLAQQSSDRFERMKAQNKAVAKVDMDSGKLTVHIPSKQKPMLTRVAKPAPRQHWFRMEPMVPAPSIPEGELRIDFSRRPPGMRGTRNDAKRAQDRVKQQSLVADAMQRMDGM